MNRMDRNGTKRPCDGSARDRLAALRSRVRAREAAANAADAGGHDGDDDTNEKRSREGARSLARAGGSADSEVGIGEPVGCAASDFATSLLGTGGQVDAPSREAMRTQAKTRRTATNIAGEGSHDGDDDAEEDEDAKEEGGSADSEVRTGEPVGCAASDLATSLPGAARELQWELGIQA